jgi:hypothetical protein
LVSSQHKQNDPSIGFEYYCINIPNIQNFGTGLYEVAIQSNALKLPFPITCTAISKPKFQILLCIYSDTREILILLGRVDNTPPIDQKIFILPRNIASSKTHIIKVKFSNWKITTLTLDDQRLKEYSQGQEHLSKAKYFLDEISEITKSFRLDQPRSINGPLLEPVHPLTGLAFPILKAQKTLLEKLFGGDWFTKNSKRITTHPAFIRWKLCDDLLKRYGELRFPQDRNHFPLLTKMLLDNSFFITCTNGHYEDFSFGSLANYGDAEVQKRIQSVIPNPSQFLDVMTELSCAAFHISRGHSLMVHQELSFPDFEILLPDWNIPVAMECKRINKDSSNRRIEKVINKANKQIKSLGKPCYGLVLIDVSDKVEISTELSDNVPLEITDLKEVILRAITNLNTSISAVLLIWDDFSIIETPKPIGSNIALCIIRKNMLIHHKQPIYPIEKDLESITIGHSLIMSLKLIPNNLLPNSWVWRPI